MHFCTRHMQDACVFSHPTWMLSFLLHNYMKRFWYKLLLCVRVYVSFSIDFTLDLYYKKGKWQTNNSNLSARLLFAREANRGHKIISVVAQRSVIYTIGSHCEGSCTLEWQYALFFAYTTCYLFPLSLFDTSGASAHTFLMQITWL